MSNLQESNYELVSIFETLSGIVIETKDMIDTLYRSNEVNFNKEDTKYI
jgi:hypothetical protein